MHSIILHMLIFKTYGSTFYKILNRILLIQNLSEDQILRAFNHYLRKEDIRVLQTTKVSNDFHARFCAKERTYLYRIIVSPTPLSPFLHRRVWHIPTKERLNIEEMRNAANTCFVGKPVDYASFQASGAAFIVSVSLLLQIVGLIIRIQFGK